MTEPTSPAIPRRLSLLAGLAALVAGAVRHLRTHERVDMMAAELPHPAHGAIVTIVWHSFTAILFILGALLIVSAWRSRGFARATAILTALVCGVSAILMGGIAGAQLGDPFAFYPIFALAGLAALSAVAFVKA